MHAIRAIWTNGKIVPEEPVDWPEGSELLVEPIFEGEKTGLTEEEWQDDPESIAAWIEAVNKIEPLKWSPGEQDAFEAQCRASREFNMNAVRKQMEEMTDGDGS